MNTRQPTQLLTTFLTALGAVAASAVLGLNLAAQADQAAAKPEPAAACSYAAVCASERTAAA